MFPTSTVNQTVFTKQSCDLTLYLNLREAGAVNWRLHLCVMRFIFESDWSKSCDLTPHRWSIITSEWVLY